MPKKPARIPDRTWSAHAVAVLRRHPRAETIDMLELANLAEPIRQALQAAYARIDEESRSWVATANDRENHVLFAAVWQEAAALWLKQTTAQ